MSAASSRGTSSLRGPLHHVTCATVTALHLLSPGAVAGTQPEPSEGLAPSSPHGPGGAGDARVVDRARGRGAGHYDHATSDVGRTRSDASSRSGAFVGSRTRAAAAVAAYQPLLRLQWTRSWQRRCWGSARIRPRLLLRPGPARSPQSTLTGGLALLTWLKGFILDTTAAPVAVEASSWRWSKLPLSAVALRPLPTASAHAVR